MKSASAALESNLATPKLKKESLLVAWNGIDVLRSRARGRIFWTGWITVNLA